MIFRFMVASLFHFIYIYTASVVQWPEFLTANTEVPGLIPGPTRFSE
jgi:hypothetical protein